MVNIALRVLSRPDALQIPVLHKELGIDFDEKVCVCVLIVFKKNICEVHLKKTRLISSEERLLKIKWNLSHLQYSNIFDNSVFQLFFQYLR